MYVYLSLYTYIYIYIYIVLARAPGPGHSSNAIGRNMDYLVRPTSCAGRGTGAGCQAGRPVKYMLC